MPQEKKPISQKQLEANRRNAQKSTGPTSVRGRAISSQNSCKHNPLPFEDPALPAQLTTEYYSHFIPVNRAERTLVNTMIHCDRRRHHYLALQACLEPLTPEPTLSMTLSSQIDAAESLYRNARRQLEAMRAAYSKAA